ncbi:MAG: hypothetical protein AAGI07_16925, partial [Bacteroidota bacterium]
MANLKHLFERKKSVERLQRVKEKFSYKPFTEEYKDLRGLLLVVRYFLAVFSITTGFGFLLSSIDFLPIWIGGGIVLTALVLLELLKNILADKAITTYYCDKLSIVALPALVVFGLSVYLSVNGAKVTYEKIDTSLEDIESEYETKRDSINNFFDDKTKTIETSLAEFKNSVTWKGKINIYDGTVKETIKRHNNDLIALGVEHSIALADFKETYIGIKTRAENKWEFNGTFWLVASCIVEVSILLCLWFISYYDYKLYQEADIIEPTETYEIDSYSLGNLIRLAKQYSVPNSGANQYLISNEEKEQKKIGFQSGATVPKKPDRTGGNVDFSSVPDDIIGAIKSGTKDPRILMKKFKLNVIQVNQYLKEYS